MAEKVSKDQPKAKPKAMPKATPKVTPKIIPEVAAKVMPKAKKAIGVSKYKGMYQSVGKRKSAVARVRLSDKGDKTEIIVNEMPMNDYFNSPIWQKTILAPLDICGLLNKVYISVKVKGGGPMGQAEAIRHGITKIMVAINEGHRKPLKALGFLTRDPRVKERKKPGLKGARRAPQWSKR